MRIDFEQVKLRTEKTGKCKCGVKRKRTKTFMQTINPFNKNKKGMVKDSDEIYLELRAEAAKWRKEPIVCQECE